MWVEIVLVVVLILVNAALSGSEMALVTLRESQVNRMATESDRGKRLSALIADPNRFLSTIQVGITLAGFLASATAAVSLAEPLVEPLGFLGDLAQPASVVVVTLVLSYLSLVLGELVPKRIAMQTSQGWALKATGPIGALATITHPVVWLLAKSTDGIVRLFGFDPHAKGEEVTEEEIKDMIAASGTIAPEQRSIIEGAMELDERRLWQILVPRSEVLFLAASMPVAEGRERLIEAGLSRAPVTGEEEDDVVGVVHIRALVDTAGLVGDYIRPAIVLPDSVGVLQALGRMKAERGQMALVVDEFGSVAGIVTLEDVLEEIVGEIYDEYDRDTADVVHRPDGSMELPGSFPAHDLGDLGVEIEPGRHATIAGIALEELGEIPEVGTEVTVEGWVVTVLEVTDRAILRVRMAPRAEGGDAAAPPADATDVVEDTAGPVAPASGATAAGATAAPEVSGPDR